MNDFNLRDLSISEDQLCLKNLQGHDLFNQLGKVQSNSERENSHYSVKQQMQDQMYHNVSRRKSKDSRSNINSKDKKKVFYRDKMAELMKPGEYVKQEYKYVTYTTADPNKIPISKEEQLKRNRQSAKNSRQRKKEYVTFLQMKNQENNKIIQELTYKLQQVTLQRDRLKEDHHNEIKNFCKSKAQAYSNLQIALKQTESTHDDIKTLINDMMNRFGTSGSERMEIINYYMNEIIEVLVSDIHKYFLTCSPFAQNYVTNNPPKSIDFDVMTILKLDLIKLGSMVSKYKQRFAKQTTVFKDLTQELYRVFKSISTQGKVIQLVFAEMMKQIDPKALGQLILWFEQNRFCSRQIKRVKQEWVKQLKTGEQVIQILRKQTKQEHKY